MLSRRELLAATAGVFGADAVTVVEKQQMPALIVIRVPRAATRKALMHIQGQAERMSALLRDNGDDTIVISLREGLDVELYWQQPQQEDSKRRMRGG